MEFVWYTNSMQNFIENLGYRKLAIIMIIGSVIVLVILLYTAAKALAPSPSPSNSSTNTNSNNTTNSQNSSQNGWKTFQGDSFQIQYPVNFKTSEGIFINGGTSTAFDGENGTQVTIETYDSAKKSFANLISQIPPGYSVSGKNISGVLAESYSGVVTLSPNTFQQKILIFEKNGKSYQIIFTYLSKNPNGNLDSIFNKMVNSLNVQ